jgi:hypothetical protein
MEAIYSYFFQNFGESVLNYTAPYSERYYCSTSLFFLGIKKDLKIRFHTKSKILIGFDIFLSIFPRSLTMITCNARNSKLNESLNATSIEIATLFGNPKVRKNILVHDSFIR